MLFKKYFFSSFLLFVISLLCFSVPVLARKQITDAPQLLNQSTQRTGISRSDIVTTVGTLIQGVLGAVGLVFFLLMFYGGFLWLTARGEENQIATAKKTITSALIGIIVLLASYAITAFVTGRLVG